MKKIAYRKMIDSDKALKLILDKTHLLKKESKNLYDALDYSTSNNIYSKIDFPPFDQSAMDGYAFRWEDYISNNTIKIKGEIQAGSYFNSKIDKNIAVRIFTGASVPSGVDTVVMQENIKEENENLIINDKNIKQGSNIRKQGSQTQKGVLALPENTNITPGIAGFLAGLGQYKIDVIKKPRICIITTGKELVKPGGKISKSKIFESNSFSLNAALKQSNITDINIFTVDDIPEIIESCINENLSKCDIMIITGGVSVGDYDFVVESLNKCRVKKQFHRVKQKPGKPLYFGTFKNSLVFGLPGNPSAVLTCYYIYVLPAILKMTGYPHSHNIETMLLTNDFTKKSGLTYFLKGKKCKDGVKALHSQESYQMNSFVEADCIIKLDEEREKYIKGDLVEVISI